MNDVWRAKKKSFARNFTTGQILMEILIGVGVMGVILTGVVGVMVASLRSVRVTREKSIAQSLINDTAAAVKGVVQSDWHDLWSSNNGRGYWPIDEGVGAAGTNNLILDQIYGNHGTINLGFAGNTFLSSAWTATSSCKIGQCLSLDGIDDYIDLGDPADGSLDFATSSFSYGLWVYAAASTGTIDMPWWKGGEGPTIPGYTFALGTNIWQAAVADGATMKTLTLCNEINNQWIHLLAVVDRSTNHFYVYKNGMQVASTSIAGFGSVSNSYRARLGSNAFGNNDFNGRIDDLRVYNRALSSAEVTNLYSGVNSLYPARLSGTWQIKEGKESQSIGGIVFTRSFAVESVMRGGSNNIVLYGGTDDPLTKRIVYTVTWRDRTLSVFEYVFRETDSVFTQTDWSDGLTGTTTVFTAPAGFMAASSGIVYAAAGVLSSQLGAVGALESFIFDAQMEKGVVPVAIVWQGILGANSQVRFQIASSNSVSGPWVFVGDDGTALSYYPITGAAQPNTTISISPKYHFNQRYLRYKIYLTSSADGAPLVEDVSITWKQ